MNDEQVLERVAIEIDEDGLTVFAVILAGAETIEYSEQCLEQQLAKQDLSGLTLLENTHSEIAALFNDNHSGKVKVGIKRDARVEVIVSKDMLTANLRITAASGGKRVGVEQVVAAIDEQEVDHRLINKKRIVGLVRKSRIIESGSVVEVIFAKGKAPEHGLDTQFRCLVDGVTDRKPHERDDGTLDYYDLGEILCIDEGSELMRKYPPKVAKLGQTVTGKEIPARIGKKLNFSKCKGAKVSSGDQDLLIAEIKGQPIIADKSINVENILTVKNVDLHTGHIEYDGSVIVKGDVASGMKVKVTGDVQIFGMVENALIEAEGNVDIKLGAIGHLERSNAENTMHIKCMGNLTAAYLENAHVNCQGDILIKSRVSNCEINAAYQVIVGNSRQQKSGIVGGYVNAGTLIRAEVLGSSGCALTHVAIVCSAEILTQFETIPQTIKKNDELLIKQLGVMVGLSKKHTDEAKQQLHELKIESELMKSRINNLIKQKSDLEVQMRTVEIGKVTAQKEAYPGVHIKILEQELEIKSKYGSGSFFLTDGVMSHNSKVN